MYSGIIDTYVDAALTKYQYLRYGRTPNNRGIGASVMGHNSKSMAVGTLKMMKNYLQIYGQPCYSVLTADQSSFNSFQNQNRIGYHPHLGRVVLLAMLSVDPYSMQ